MGRLKKPRVLENRPGRPQRDITAQEEIMEELHIVSKDFEEGFYGKANDLDIKALTADLGHVIQYAEEIAAGVPMYPATGDEYMLSKWEQDMREHERKLNLNVLRDSGYTPDKVVERAIDDKDDYRNGNWRFDKC